MRSLILVAMAIGCAGAISPAATAAADTGPVLSGCYNLTITKTSEETVQGSFCVTTATDLTFWGPVTLAFPGAPNGPASGTATGLVRDGMVWLSIWPGYYDASHVWPNLMVDGQLNGDHSITGIAAGEGYSYATLTATPK